MARLTMALDAEDAIRFIGEVAGGSACGCVCPVCGSKLVARLGTVHDWHFSHEAGQERPGCLAGAVNLFSRLLLAHLHLAGSGIGLPVEGLRGVTLRAILPCDPGGNGPAALLSDGRRCPVFVHLKQPRHPPNTPPGADHLLCVCPLPPAEVLAKRQATALYIARHARLRWHGRLRTAAAPAPLPLQAVGKPMPAYRPLSLAPDRRTPVSIYCLLDGSDWVIYKNLAGILVLRQWPSATPGCDRRFLPGVGAAHPGVGAYEVADFLSASSALRSNLRRPVLHCNSLDRVQSTLGGTVAQTG